VSCCHLGSVVFVSRQADRVALIWQPFGKMRQLSFPKTNPRVVDDRGSCPPVRIQDSRGRSRITTASGANRHALCKTAMTAAEVSDVITHVRSRAITPEARSHHRDACSINANRCSAGDASLRWTNPMLFGDGTSPDGPSLNRGV